MTWVMSSTSIPRAATSVATSTCNRSRRNASRTRVLAACDLLLWIAAASTPLCFSIFSSLSAVRFVRVNTIARRTPSPCRICCNFGCFSFGAVIKIVCVILLTFFDLGDTFTLTGSNSNCRASSTIFGCNVAEKEKGLPFFRQAADESFQIWKETHVEHPIDFVQDKGFQSIKIDMALVDEIQKSSRSGDQDVRPALQ